MGDKNAPIIVDVQGIGPVEFPPGTSGAQIEAWVLGQLRQSGVPSQSWGQWLGNMAGRVAGGIAGGALGSLAGPVGTFAGTATGAALGEEWAQRREVKQGVRDNVNPLSIMASGATAAIPGATVGAGPLLRQVPRAFAAGTVGGGASSAAMQYAETGAVDPWQTGKEAVTMGTLGTLMGIGAPAAVRGAQSKAAQKLVRDETGAIRLYHGSPHDFDQFSTEKIGTGEGAQAYGHGLYFAESPHVAESYYHALSDDAIRFADGRVVKPSPGSVEDRALAFLATYSGGGMGIDNPHRFARNEVQKLIDRGHGANQAGEMEQLTKIRDTLYEWEHAGVTAGRAGKRYEVNIDADPEQFLDWDKPLSEQSPRVREALAPVLEKLAQRYEARGSDIGRQSAASIREQRVSPGALMDGTYSKEVADDLMAAGVPGLRYFDEYSRPDMPRARELRANAARHTAAGEHDYAAEAIKLAESIEKNGTRNYVVFDDKLVSILRKYGMLPFIPLSQVGRPQPEGKKDKR